MTGKSLASVLKWKSDMHLRLIFTLLFVIRTHGHLLEDHQDFPPLQPSRFNDCPDSLVQVALPVGRIPGEGYYRATC